MRHRAKFCADRSRRGEDMAVFDFFKMAAVSVNVQNLVLIGAVVSIICKF